MSDVDVHEERMELLYAHLADTCPAGIDPKIIEEITAPDYEGEGE